MHEPGTDTRIWTCDVWWAARIGAAHVTLSGASVYPTCVYATYIPTIPFDSILPNAYLHQPHSHRYKAIPSCRREVGASWTDVAVTLVAGIGGPAAGVAGLVARPLPLGEMARVVAQLGCDRGLHQHVPLRVQSVPVVGGVNVLVDTAM